MLSWENLKELIVFREIKYRYLIIIFRIFLWRMLIKVFSWIVVVM